MPELKYLNFWFCNWSKNFEISVLETQYGFINNQPPFLLCFRGLINLRETKKTEIQGDRETKDPCSANPFALSHSKRSDPYMIPPYILLLSNAFSPSRLFFLHVIWGGIFTFQLKGLCTHSQYPLVVIMAQGFS